MVLSADVSRPLRLAEVENERKSANGDLQEHGLHLWPTASKLPTVLLFPHKTCMPAYSTTYDWINFVITVDERVAFELPTKLSFTIVVRGNLHFLIQLLVDLLVDNPLKMERTHVVR